MGCKIIVTPMISKREIIGVTIILHKLWDILPTLRTIDPCKLIKPEEPVYWGGFFCFYNITDILGR